MQSASANFALAASGGSVTWTEPQIIVDWDVDDVTDGIDDMSGVAGRIRVEQSLDNSLPDRFGSSHELGTASAVVELTAGTDLSPPDAYFSAFNSESPFYGYDRDIAPTTIAHGLVSSAGPERVTVFTGQMIALPVVTGKAQLQAASATRLALTQAVQPPAVSRRYGGLTASWPVSWTLAQCGIYASPPPRSGCRWWVPMHGSTAAFLPSTNDLLANTNPFVGGISRTSDQPAAVTIEATFVSGPFVTAADGAITSDGYFGVAGGSATADRLADGADLLSKAGSKGRVEFYARGDSFDINSTPGGSASWPYGAASWLFTTAAGPYVVAGINSSRKVFVTVNDGTNTATFTSTGTLPTDGAWYRCGAAWNVSGNKLWVFLDGTAQSNTPSPALSTTGLATDDTFGEEATSFGFSAGIPVAELQVTTGSDADPALTPTWIGDSFTASAVVWPSLLELECVAEPVAREAFELISSYAKAELAMVRTDETDRFLYLPLSYWAETSQQTVADTLSTDTNIGELSANYDPGKIVNSVTVQYQPRRVDELVSMVANVTTMQPLPPGTTTFEVALDTPAIALYAGGPLHNLTASDVAAGASNFFSYDGLSFISINAASDGSGSYATTAQVEATITSWHPGGFTLEVTNHTGATWYMVNNGASTGISTPFLGVFGLAVPSGDASITEEETSSVAVRGTRGITVSGLDQIQRLDAATRLARRLALEYAYPVAELGDVRTFGDPRRQPGDLVSVTDPKRTRISGSFRSMRVTHDINGADYQQTLRLARALPVGIWGVSAWGQCIWGPSS